MSSSIPVSHKIITRTPTKTFQLRKVIKNSEEQEKTLREQLHLEIEKRSKACANSTFTCSIPRLEGYEFCIRHILQDPRAPYKQCAYVYPTNGKRCNQAAPKHDSKKESSQALTVYCFEHSRLIQLQKTHEIVGQFKQVETNEAYLNDLTHHVKVDTASNVTDTEEEIDVVSPNVEPFINYVHVTNFNGKHEDKEKRRVLDYASDTSSDNDIPNLNNTWKNYELDNSDDESIDSQNDDVLKHAGIYTTEEAAMITKQKLIRLRSLYNDQLSFLNYLLKEKRRKYLQELRKERETLCSIHDQPKDTPLERKLYEKLKAFNHYHKRYGVEAVLRKKLQERRLKAAETYNAHKGPLYTKCIFTEGGVKCGERALPCSKYCKKHILEDKKQILFRACGIEKSGIICQEPVPNIFEDATCVLHIKFPNQKSYTQKKFESETEEENDDGGNLKKAKYDEMNIKNGNKIEIDNKHEIERKTPIIVDKKIEGNLISIKKEFPFEENDDIEMLISVNELKKNVTTKHDKS